MRGCRIAGRVCAVAGAVLWVLVQVVAGDPFPPEISESQYGLGAAGWLFSLWAIVLASSPVLLFRSRPVPGRAGPFLAIGWAGSAVMAVVRTDEGYQPMTWHAQVHMVGAVLALVFLPLGMASALRWAGRAWRRLSHLLVAAAAVAGALLLLAAVGLDTAGFGPARSWAFWQGTLVVIEMLLVGLYALAVGTIDPRSVRIHGGAPVQSAIQ